MYEKCYFYDYDRRRCEQGGGQLLDEGILLQITTSPAYIDLEQTRRQPLWGNMLINKGDGLPITTENHFAHVVRKGEAMTTIIPVHYLYIPRNGEIAETENAHCPCCKDNFVASRRNGLRDPFVGLNWVKGVYFCYKCKNIFKLTITLTEKDRKRCL